MVWFDTHAYFQIKTFLYKVIAWDSCNKKLNRKKSTGTLYVKKNYLKLMHIPVCWLLISIHDVFEKLTVPGNIIMQYMYQ